MNNKANYVRYNVDTHHHGLFIKEARIRKDKRLKDVAAGICDVSYLSKIEAGLVIPAPDIFVQLVQKLEIVMPYKHRKHFVKDIREIIYANEGVGISGYLASENLHEYELQLGRFFQAVLSDKQILAMKLMKNIDQLVLHFNLEEKQLYFLFCGIYFFKTYDWEKGKKAFKTSFDLTFKLDEDPLLYYHFSRYYFQTQNMSLGFAFINLAIDKFQKVYAKKWVFKCMAIRIREHLKNNEIDNAIMHSEELESIVTSNSEQSVWNEFFNLQGLIYEKQQLMQQAEQNLLQSVDLENLVANENHLLDLVRFYYHQDARAKFLELIEKIDFVNISKGGQLLLDFYYYKVADVPSEELELFLKTDALPYATRTLNAREFEIYTKEITRLYRQRMRHKKVADAYYDWERFRDGLELNGII